MRWRPALTESGVGIGRPVAIDLPAGIPHAVALHGAILAGAVVQSMPPAGRDGVDVAPGTRFVDAGWVAEASSRAGPGRRSAAIRPAR